MGRVRSIIGRFGARRAWWVGVGLGLGLALGSLAMWPAGCGQRATRNQPLADAPVVRVLLLEGQQQVTLSGTQPALVRVNGAATADNAPPKSYSLKFPGGGKGLTAYRTSAGWHVGRQRFGGGELVIQPAADGSVRVNGKPYRGRYRLVPSASSASAFDVVNDVDVESYLKGVVSKELLRDWHDQAYQAQAIVARTYALYEWRMNAASAARRPPHRRHFDLFADTRSQVYGGMSAETDKSREAVDATAGVVAAYGPTGDERIFKAYFSACCGGVSQSAADAFGGSGSHPALVDQNVGTRCSASPRFAWGPVAVPKDELTRRFRRWAASRNHPLKDMGALARIDIESYNGSGRPTRFTVTDALGRRYSLTSEEVRWAVNTGAPANATLNSGFFTPVNDQSVVRFSDGHGWGHGVGMCQWCAQQQAVQGVRHETIVLGAFPGSTLQRAY